MSVDFPAPFSPISAWISPPRTVKSTPSSARTPGNERLIEAICRRGELLIQKTNLATDGAQTNTDEKSQQFDVSNRWSSVPHRWLNLLHAPFEDAGGVTVAEFCFQPQGVGADRLERERVER